MDELDKLGDVPAEWGGKGRICRAHASRLRAAAGGETSTEGRCGRATDGSPFLWNAQDGARAGSLAPNFAPLGNGSKTARGGF